MQQNMLRTSMATNLEHRRLLHGGAATSGGSLVPFSDSALAAAPHSFAIDEHDVVLDGKPLPIRCSETHFARVPREYRRQGGALTAINDQNSDYRITAWSGKEIYSRRFDTRKRTRPNKGGAGESRAQGIRRSR